VMMTTTRRATTVRSTGRTASRGSRAGGGQMRPPRGTLIG
jgi:hypothetical protein